MGLQLKLLFGVVDLLVMDVLFNPMIQDLCIFLSLPLDINNGFLIQWGVYQSLQETQNNYVNITPAVLIQKLLCSVAIILFGGYGTNIYFYGIQQGGQIRFRKEARTGALAPDRFFWSCFNV